MEENCRVYSARLYVINIRSTKISSFEISIKCDLQMTRRFSRIAFSYQSKSLGLIEIHLSISQWIF